MIATVPARGGSFLFLFVILAVMIAIGLVGIQHLDLFPSTAPLPKFNSHAAERHGMEADWGRQCVGKGTLFHNPTTNRFANVCETDQGFFGVWVWRLTGDNRAEEVTSFVKNKMKNFNQIRRYMENAGYKIIH